MQKRLSVFLTAMICHTASPLYAENAHHDDHAHHHKKAEASSHRAHDHEEQVDTASLSAHAHGSANLDIAALDQSLEMSLTSPSINIVGFEHAAQSESQQQAIKKSQQLLLAPQALFTFNGSACEMKNISSDFSAVEAATEQKPINKTHSDIHVHYRFQCQDITALKSITVNLLKAFPAIKNLQTRWIIQQRQGIANISQTSQRINID